MKYELINVQVTSLFDPNAGPRAELTRHRLRNRGVSTAGVTQLFQGQIVTEAKDRQIIAAIVIDFERLLVG